MDIALNELSFGQPRGEAEARAAGLALVELLRELNQHARQGIRLLSPAPARDMMLSSKLSLQAWMGDPAHKEHASRLRTFLSKAPTFQAVHSDEAPRWDLLEFSLDGRRAVGLGIAADRDGIGVSLGADPPLDQPHLSLDRFELDEDGEAQTAGVQVRHAASLAHAAAHRQHLSTRVVEPSTPADLLANRGLLYPRLRWAPRVEPQLTGLAWGSPHFHAIRRRLRELDTAAAAWDRQRQPEPDWLSHVTPEHEGRKRLCWFDDHEKQNRCFHLHARFTPGAGRIHLWCDRQRGLVVVGHIGEKLSI
jgi:hypothetical protein